MNANANDRIHDLKFTNY